MLYLNYLSIKLEKKNQTGQVLPSPLVRYDHTHQSPFLVHTWYIHLSLHFLNCFSLLKSSSSLSTLTVMWSVLKSRFTPFLNINRKCLPDFNSGCAEASVGDVRSLGKISACCRGRNHHLGIRKHCP